MAWSQRRLGAAALDKNPIKPRKSYRQTPMAAGTSANIVRGLCRLLSSRRRNEVVSQIAPISEATMGSAFRATRRRGGVIGKWMKCLAFVSCTSVSAMLATPLTADEAKNNRILVEYVPPTNPNHDALYQLLGTTLTGAALRRRIERLLSDTQCDPLNDAVQMKIARGART